MILESIQYSLKTLLQYTTYKYGKEDNLKNLSSFWLGHDPCRRNLFKQQLWCLGTIVQYGGLSLLKSVVMQRQWGFGLKLPLEAVVASWEGPSSSGSCPSSWDPRRKVPSAAAPPWASWVDPHIRAGKAAADLPPWGGWGVKEAVAAWRGAGGAGTWAGEGHGGACAHARPCHRGRRGRADEEEGGTTEKRAQNRNENFRVWPKSYYIFRHIVLQRAWEKKRWRKKISSPCKVRVFIAKELFLQYVRTDIDKVAKCDYNGKWRVRKKVWMVPTLVHYL